MASDLDRVLEAIRAVERAVKASSQGEAHLKLDEILRRESVMAGELAKLTQEVAETKTVINSAIALIQGIKARLDEAIASGNPAALAALSASLDSDQAALAAAIVANTPQPPPAIVLPDGVAGQAYSGNLVASFTGQGGIAPFNFALVGGALPPGFKLDSSNGNLGNAPDADGNPTFAVAGDYSFTVQRQDADAGTIDETESFTLHVA